MNVKLSAADLDTLIESIAYSKRAIQDAQGTPYEVRKENLARIEGVEAKLRAARRASS